MSLSNVSSFFFHIDDVLWWYHQIFDVEVLMLRDMGVDGPLWYYSLVKVVHLWAKMSWWLAESCSSTAIDDDDNASKQCSSLKKKKNQGYGTLLMPKIQASRFGKLYPVKAKIAVKPLPLLTSIVPQKLKKSIIEDDFGNVVN